MSFLVTGGAGYIGAHLLRALTDAGERVVAYDDLSSGDAARVPEGVPLVVGSTLDRDLLERTFAAHRITTVAHLAARHDARESLVRPLHYYEENLQGLRTVLDAARGARVRRMVFASSAAVYGDPGQQPVSEEGPCAPTTPYGETKLAGEWLVRSAGRAFGMATACLRMFNVVGAAEPGLADTSGARLVPMVFEDLAAGAAPQLFGTDYPTPDGTCVRDYIHVEDVAEAHLAVVAALDERPAPDHLVLNIGRGIGLSVREMTHLVAEITGHRGLAPAAAPRRPGDPASLVACTERAAKTLRWSPRREAHEMVGSAWAGWRIGN